MLQHPLSECHRRGGSSSSLSAGQLSARGDGYARLFLRLEALSRADGGIVRGCVGRNTKKTCWTSASLKSWAWRGILIGLGRDLAWVSRSQRDKARHADKQGPVT